MTKRVSITDIAKSLGVSKALVSLVVNNKGDAHGISAETQKKVREKVLELNYKPDLYARSFRMGKTHTIGLIVSDISNRFYARLARNLEDLARIRGYSVIICSTDEDVEKEKEQIRLLRDRKIDGLVISSSQNSADIFDSMQKEGFPHVLIDRKFEGMASANVSVDNYGGARMAARHLLGQGYKDFAMISVTPQHIVTIRDRIEGFLETLTEAGLQMPVSRHIEAPFSHIEMAVKEGIQQWYQSGRMPRAIFTLNNNLTSACLKNLRKLSVNIPKEVALIGFDDVVYYEFTSPSISAISQPVDRIGQTAFELLLRQIDKTAIPQAEKSVVLPVDIIIRESSLKTQ